jgi:hypothetical protein
MVLAFALALQPVHLHLASHFWVLILLLSLVAPTSADFTVDDQAPRIVYTGGSWNPQRGVVGANNGTLSRTTAGNVTVTFVGELNLQQTKKVVSLK